MPELHDTGARYEMVEQGETSYADYRLTGGRLYIDYVSPTRRCAARAPRGG
jgi:hypothetical protein